MNKALAELIKISNAAGKDAAYVQGGGGNTSVKSDDGKYMYIKASGTALKDMNARNGWRRMGIDSVLAILEDANLPRYDVNTREVEVVNRLLLACDDNVTGGARPSVEAPLHAFLEKCVIHLHPIAIGAYVNTKDGRAKLEKMFKNEKLPPLWVPYVDPGFCLARKIAQLVASYKKQHGKIPAILFLEKHGLFVSAKTANTTLRLVKRVIDTCNKSLKQPRKGMVKKINAELITNAKLTVRKAYFDAVGDYTTVSYFYDDAIAAFMADKNAPKMLAVGTLTPDELVYANGPTMWVEKPDAARISAKLKSQLQKGMKPAVAFLVKGVGLLVAGRKKVAPTVRDIAASSFFIRTNALRLGGIATLNNRQQHFINNWEAEAFRKKVAGGSSEGLLKDRIAIVTGAGSGLGRSIAMGLARAGAQVALADIDTTGAEETAAMIKSELTDASTMVVGCNVTDELSVDDSFNRLLDNWGGLDILVNAAGVAPAYSLVDLPVDKWRFALEVNLTGYFLMARAAARIMIQQDMAGRIVNISSKSGIDASKDNTPYNATKAGELHMSRGWAMELGTHGITVNSVCPGNVFEGSKIWNPSYIRTCAKKYGIKPEEVIPYYVSRTMLNREIKGRDIADSVVFFASDKARRITGQTLVTDAGQAMVR